MKTKRGILISLMPRRSCCISVHVFDRSAGSGSSHPNPNSQISGKRILQQMTTGLGNPNRSKIRAVMDRMERLVGSFISGQSK